jgi:hypothetical protein
MVKQQAGGHKLMKPCWMYEQIEVSREILQMGIKIHICCGNCIYLEWDGRCKRENEIIKRQVVD